MNTRKIARSAAFAGGGIDDDAQLIIDAMVTAGVTVDATSETYINTFVKDLCKANNVYGTGWSGYTGTGGQATINVLALSIGSSNNSLTINCADFSTMTVNGTMVSGSGGAKSNGTNGYVNSNFNGASTTFNGSWFGGFYDNDPTTGTTSKFAFGRLNSSMNVVCYNNISTGKYLMQDIAAPSVRNITMPTVGTIVPKGGVIFCREGLSSFKLSHLGSTIYSDTASVTVTAAGINFSLWARNNNGTIDNYNNRQIASMIIGYGATEAQANAISGGWGAVEAILSRNV